MTSYNIPEAVRIKGINFSNVILDVDVLAEPGIDSHVFDGNTDILLASFPRTGEYQKLI